MAIEIVDFPMKLGYIVHSYVSHSQRVYPQIDVRVKNILNI